MSVAVGQVTSTLRPLKQQNLTAGCSQLRSPQRSWGPGWPRPGCRPGWQARPGPGPPPRPLAWHQDLAPRRPLVSGHPLVLPRGPPKTEALASSRRDVLSPVPRLQAASWRPRVRGVRGGQVGPARLCAVFSFLRPPQAETGGGYRPLGAGSWFTPPGPPVPRHACRGHPTGCGGELADVSLRSGSGYSLCERGGSSRPVPAALGVLCRVGYCARSLASDPAPQTGQWFGSR